MGNSCRLRQRRVVRLFDHRMVSPCCMTSISHYPLRQASFDWLGGRCGASLGSAASEASPSSARNYVSGKVPRTTTEQKRRSERAIIRVLGRTPRERHSTTARGKGNISQRNFSGRTWVLFPRVISMEVQLLAFATTCSIVHQQATPTPTPSQIVTTH